MSSSTAGSCTPGSARWLRASVKKNGARGRRPETDSRPTLVGDVVGQRAPAAFLDLAELRAARAQVLLRPEALLVAAEHVARHGQALERLVERRRRQVRPRLLRGRLEQADDDVAVGREERRVLLELRLVGGVPVAHVL